MRCQSTALPAPSPSFLLRPTPLSQTVKEAKNIHPHAQHPNAAALIVQSYAGH